MLDRRRGRPIARIVGRSPAIRDLAAGRVRGVLAWTLVDTALQTGLRVSAGRYQRNAW